jgi:hypothetical protein
MPTARKTQDVIEIPNIETVVLRVGILGLSPLIVNRMSRKAKETLLNPPPAKNRAQRASTLKHDPISEFRDSVYVLPAGGPTLLGFLASAFKGAMVTAASDIPGVTGAKIKRLVTVLGDLLPLYGIPKLHMSVVRNSDPARTPDIRTRAIFPRWGMILEVQAVAPLITPVAVSRLLFASGRTVGVGEWRPEKGAGAFGMYEIVDEDDPRLLALMAESTAEAQAAALRDAEPYDDEAVSLLESFFESAESRGLHPTLPGQ